MSEDQAKDAEALNRHGDKVIKTTGEHGADISSQRMGNLDEDAVRHVLDTREDPVTAVDIGCGLGIQGIRFGLLGVETTLIDVLDISNRVEAFNEMFEMCSLDFVNKDVRELTRKDIPDNIGTAYSQRFIHYLKFDEALDLCELISNKMVEEGRIFISASGLHTELGDGYPDKDTPLESRYSKLDPEMADKHDIRDQVCLYTNEDMERLLSESGLTPVRVDNSGFGNIKAIGEKK